MSGGGSNELLLTVLSRVDNRYTILCCLSLNYATGHAQMIGYGTKYVQTIQKYLNASSFWYLTVAWFHWQQGIQCNHGSIWSLRRWILCTFFVARICNG